jgi:beta-lactamase class D
MTFHTKFILGIITFAIFSTANAAKDIQWQENEAISALFTNAKLKGTFVLYDIKNDKLIGHNALRAKTRFIPFSTFKIPNSLIGLSIGAVKNVDDVFPYDGKPRWMKSWEKSMGLREAIKVSNLPVYQELARRIGHDRMETAIKQLNYGNANIGNIVDNFWLKGPLKISAIEQAQFLAKLAQGTLPFPADVQKTVQEITVQEQSESWTLHFKTGSGNIGWWVGWVNKGDDIYSFALNVDEKEDMLDIAERLKKRIDLGRASLKLLGISN